MIVKFISILDYVLNSVPLFNSVHKIALISTYLTGFSAYSTSEAIKAATSLGVGSGEEDFEGVVCAGSQPRGRAEEIE